MRRDDVSMRFQSKVELAVIRRQKVVSPDLLKIVKVVAGFEASVEVVSVFVLTLTGGDVNNYPGIENRGRGYASANKLNRNVY